MTQNQEAIGLIGNGGQADEVESYLGETAIAFRALSERFLDREDPQQVDILNPSDYQAATPVIAAIGAPALRKELVLQWPGEKFATVRASESYVDKSARIGEGTIIAPRSVITTNVEIGKHNIINVAATISHDCVLGDFVTIGPGAHIAGNVKIEDGVFVGIGAIINNRVRIASGCVIGAGAVVLDSITEENSVAVGVPAKVIEHNEDWLNEI